MTQEDYSLTEEQIQLFEVFGFLVRRNLFSPGEMNKINEEFDRRLASILEETDLKRNVFSTTGVTGPRKPPLLPACLRTRVFICPRNS